MIKAFLEKQRPIRDVPWQVLGFLLLMLAAQLMWHNLQGEVEARAEDLPAPMSTRAYVMLSMGEPLAISKLLNLWLQAFDNQPGLSLSFSQLDYHRLTQWLDTILALDPKGPYPMLVAARVYGSIQNPQRQRIMMDYIYEKFNQAPNQYWRWLAHAVVTAKHSLKDMPLALKYSRALAEKATAEHVPYWARDMHIVVLEDMGEIEAASVLVGALIDSGEITDIYELRFLTEKIRVLREKSSNNQQDVDISTK